MITSFRKLRSDRHTEIATLPAPPTPPPILHLAKELAFEPTLPDCPGVVLCNYQGEEDIAAWLALRRRAFAAERPQVGDWTREDFEREFLLQPWWRPERMWFAVDSSTAECSSPRSLIGSVTLAIRETADQPRAALHWLMVDPEHRGRAIGKMLLASAESAVWRCGFRQVCLETHARWSGAAFYVRLGYRTRERDLIDESSRPLRGT